MNQELVNCCGNCSHVTIINCGMRPLCRESEMLGKYHCEVDDEWHSVGDSCNAFKEKVRYRIRDISELLKAVEEAYYRGYEDGKDAGYTEGIKEGKRNGD